MDDEKNCDCIKMLEELIDLPRQISLMDLGELRKVDQYIRGIWIEDIKRRQQEYYLKYIPKCGLDEPSKCLIGYIYLAMLKLAICFKEKGEEIPPNVIDQSMERSMELLQKLERELPVVRRLSAEKLAEYFHDKIRKGESGFFTLILDAVHKGKNPLDGILEDPDIPDSLAKMIFNIYSKEINKMKEAAKIYIDRYGLPQIYYELDRILEKAKKEREDVEKRVSEEFERKLADIYRRLNEIESEKANVERRIIQLEEELAKKEIDIRRLEEDRKSLEENYRRIIENYEATLKEQERTIEQLKNEIRRLEHVKAELARAEAERARTEEEKRRIEEELRRIENLYNSLRNEIEELARESKEIKSKKTELEAIINALKEEDVFFDGVTSEQSRLMEIDYAKNVEKRLKELNGWKVKVSDERDRIYGELKRLDSGVTYDTLSRIPNNITITATKGFFRKQTFEVKILSHYRELYFAGVDKRKFGLAEIMPYIEQLREKGDRYVLALASTTGWSDKAINYVKNNTMLNLILVDLNSKEIYYNPANIELENYLYYLRC